MWHLLTISFYLFQFLSFRFIVIFLFFATSQCPCLFSSVTWWFLCIIFRVNTDNPIFSIREMQVAHTFLMSDAVLNFFSMEIIFLTINMIEKLKGLIKNDLNFRHPDIPRM